MVRTKIILITDTWLPDVNGVVTTYSNIQKNLPSNIEFDVIEPRQFTNWPMPGYRSLRMAWCRPRTMWRLLWDRTKWYNMQGYHVRYHIATEGMLGWAAHRALTRHHKSFTTAYHTKFPEFLKAMFGIPVWATRWYFDWFHGRSALVMCSSESNRSEHPGWRSAVLPKGVDARFVTKTLPHQNARPQLLYVGRVSREKNIEDFCDLVMPGCDKIVVGDGPHLKTLQGQYPDVKFLGYKFGDDLVRCYQQADVLVFPSRADTFGIVILEAMSCGTPCAAYPVTGAIDQILSGVNGFIDNDLAVAVTQCLTLDAESVSATVKDSTWKHAAHRMVDLISNSAGSSHIK